MKSTKISDKMIPFVSDFGARPGYVAGHCGHAVAESEWRAGFRVCERCPATVQCQWDMPDDEQPDSIQCTAEAVIAGLCEAHADLSHNIALAADAAAGK